MEGIMFKAKDYAEAENFRSPRYREAVRQYCGVGDSIGLGYDSKGKISILPFVITKILLQSGRSTYSIIRIHRYIEGKMWLGTG